MKPTLDGKLLFPRDYVSAEEFKGKDVTLTIAGIALEDLQLRAGGKKRKPVLSFRETRKKLVLNVTNAESIARIHGVRAEEWLGKPITLYPTQAQFGRETVSCIRVRLPRAQSPAPASSASAAADDVFGQKEEVQAA